MRRGGVRIRRVVDRVNTCAVAQRESPRWGHWVRRYLTTVTYTGRRSGRSFTIPVAYRRRGEYVRIPVKLPDAKNWWRNFTGTGGPLSLELDGAPRAGHAVACRDERGRVTVIVRLRD
ncbi:hypothetical protein C1701_22095 [Actinoalloteichus sp. AHMU CJ021]|nr:hypothetical protein [Actinoalloteichus caeruleus]AUS80582.1 hypothetical protein C1701_22095 [Actinoalloteichus sp. AHMU CJ021]